MKKLVLFIIALLSFSFVAEAQLYHGAKRLKKLIQIGDANKQTTNDSLIVQSTGTRFVKGVKFQTTIVLSGSVTGDLDVTGAITALKTTEQFRLSYDAANYMTFTLAADGHTTIATVDEGVGVEADINFNPDGNVGIKTAAPSTALEVTGRVTASTGFTDGTFLVNGSGVFTGVGTVTFGNGTTINNSTADLFTITEATVDIDGASTASSYASDGVITALGRISTLITTEQLRLSYDANNYAAWTVAADGALTLVTVDASAAEGDINLNPDGLVGVKIAVPLATLHVADANTSAHSLTAIDDALLLKTTRASGGIGVVGATIGFTMPSAHASLRGAAIGIIQGAADVDQTGLAFFTHPGSADNSTIVKQVEIQHDGDFLVINGSGTFNDAGNDADFRIETAGEDSALVVDGADGDVYMEGLGSGAGALLARISGTDEIVEATDATLAGLLDGNGTSGTLNNTFADSVEITGALGIGVEPARSIHTHNSTSAGRHVAMTNSTTGGTATDGFRVGIDASEIAEIWNHENTTMILGTNGQFVLTLGTDQSATFAGLIDGDGVSGSANNAIDDTLDVTGIVDSDGGFAVGNNLSIENLYGTMGFADSSRTVALTTGTYFKITNSGDSLFSTGVNCGLLFQGDSVRVPVAGNYYISWSLTMSGAQANDELHIEIFVNNVGQSGFGETFVIVNAANQFPIAGQTILDLGTNAWISLRVKNATVGDRDAVIYTGNLTVQGKYVN